MIKKIPKKKAAIKILDKLQPFLESNVHNIHVKATLNAQNWRFSLKKPSWTGEVKVVVSETCGHTTCANVLLFLLD